MFIKKWRTVKGGVVMSDQTKAHLSVKTLWVLFILGLVNAVMYCFPYIRYVFYDQQIAAMGITNTQSGKF